MRRERSRVRTRSEADDDVPEHLKCTVCYDAPYGGIEQCSRGEHNIVPYLRIEHKFSGRRRRALRRHVYRGGEFPPPRATA